MEDLDACERYLEFTVKWFADLIYFGNYPQSMIDQFGDRLPSWTPAKIALVQGSNDFIALDYYTSKFVKHRFSAPTADDCPGITEMVQQNSQGQWIIGPETDSAWLFARAVEILELG